MGVASLVIGLLSFFVSLIPLCGYVASIPAITGLVLGIIFLVQAKKREETTNNGTAIAGVVFNTLALVVLGVYTIFFAVFTETKDTVKNLFEDAISDSARVEHDSIKQEIKQEIEQELATDTATTESNPFEMSGSDESDSVTSESGDSAEVNDEAENDSEEQ